MKKSRRVNVSLKKSLLAEIDREAESLGMSRSAFLAMVARIELRKSEIGRVMKHLAETNCICTSPVKKTDYILEKRL